MECQKTLHVLSLITLPSPKANRKEESQRTLDYFSSPWVAYAKSKVIATGKSEEDVRKKVKKLGYEKYLVVEQLTLFLDV